MWRWRRAFCISERDRCGSLAGRLVSREWSTLFEVGYGYLVRSWIWGLEGEVAWMACCTAHVSCVGADECDDIACEQYGAGTGAWRYLAARCPSRF